MKRIPTISVETLRAHATAYGLAAALKLLADLVSPPRRARRHGASR